MSDRERKSVGVVDRAARDLKEAEEWSVRAEPTHGCQLALVTCIFTALSVCVCWEHFVHSLSCCLAALPVTNNNNKFELDLAENRIENCFNFRKMAHNSRREPCEIYEAQTQYSSVLAGSGCCTQRERARESEWGAT